MDIANSTLDHPIEVGNPWIRSPTPAQTLKGHNTHTRPPDGGMVAAMLHKSEYRRSLAA